MQPESPSTSSAALIESGRDKGDSTQFIVEEYRQVLAERKFVATSTMQAVGLYLALPGFGLKELVDANPPRVAVFYAAILMALNLVAYYVARSFRDMARHALEWEREFVQRGLVGRQHHELFWGYRSSVAAVAIMQTAAAVILLLKFFPRWLD